jgi:hypothetical protein
MNLFWFQNVSVLFCCNDIMTILPTSKMTLIEKLNTVARLCVYMMAVFLLMNKPMSWYIIPITGLVVTILVQQQSNIPKKGLTGDTYSDMVELGHDIAAEIEKQKTKHKVKTGNKVVPAEIVKPKPSGPVAHNSYDEDMSKEKVEDTRFTTGLFQNMSSRLETQLRDRTLQPLPYNDVLQQDQTAFAKALMGAPMSTT